MRGPIQFSFATALLSAAALLAPTIGSASLVASGPYATSGIASTSSSFVEWATGCTVTRGLEEIDKPSLGYASFGVDSNATGKADGTYGVVSLGDGGSAIVTFANAITNGAGDDFAVFENAFNSGTGRFCELAYVEVSSDGVNYFRFPSVSLTQTTTQVGGFGVLDPSNIYDLAGKDVAGEGTGFDLSELAGVSSLLDVNNVKYVKIIDVVGDIDPAYASYDSLGNIINDPWATPFASSGFDLDAVGVINAVPEPGTLALLGFAVCCLAFAAWRRHRTPAMWRKALRRGLPFKQNKNDRYYVIPRYGDNAACKKTSLCRFIPLVVLLAAVILQTVESPAIRADILTFDTLSPSTTCSIDGVNCGKYWNGADRSGGFTVDGVFFNNDYSSGAWSGFAYSNVNYTDTSVSDYTHQYAAVTGTDVSGSGNYVIGYGCSSCADLYGGSLATVTVPTGMSVVSAMFTNTTYAAASMLNGDSFAKQFTNSDWFLLTITGKNASGTSIGSVEFYLAENGTIVTDWEAVDLSSLAGAATLVFDLSSSDSGAWGMNTPAYFAMDNLMFTSVPEPMTIAMLLSAALAGTVWSRRRRRLYKMQQNQ